MARENQLQRKLDDGAELTAIERNLDAAREELACAVADLEVAAKQLADPEHWKQKARKAISRQWQCRPGTILIAGFAAGYFIGRRRRD